MADFINTIDLLGDEVVAGMIVDRSLTEFYDDTITQLGKYAFYGFSEITSISIPKVAIIPAECISNCNKLSSLSIVGATEIGHYGISGSGSALKDIYLPATPPVLTSTNSLAYIPSACIFHIPAGSLSAYQNATNWSTLTGTYTFTEDA